MAKQYLFDDFTLDLERCVLLRGEAEIALRPKSFDVLHYLVRHAGRLVSRQELMEAIWPGLIVTDDSLRQCLAEIRKALDDHQHAVVRTLPRRGYRFTPAVERMPQDADADLPYLADGIAEEILSLLFRVDGLTVIARTSSFAYKGRKANARTVARELKVSHVLDGSVRVAQGRVRIGVQLVDPESGTQLWSATYEEPLSVETLFEIQDRVAKGVREALSSRILGNPARGWRRPRAPTNIEALNRYLEGQMFLRQIETDTALNIDESAGSAIERFEASIAADPGWAPAHVALARTHHFAGGAEGLSRAKAHLLDGLRLDPDYAPAYESLGYVLHMERDFEGSLRAYERLGELGGDMTWGRAILLRSLMRFDEAVTEYRRALLRDPLSLPVKYQLAETLLCAEQYAEALAFIGAPPGDGPGTAAMATFSAMAKIGLGARSDATPWVSRVEARYRDQDQGAVDSLELVMLALAGRREERAADRDPSQLLNLRCAPEIRALAGKPRYEALLDRLGFPEQASRNAGPLGYAPLTPYY